MSWMLFIFLLAGCLSVIFTKVRHRKIVEQNRIIQEQDQALLNTVTSSNRGTVSERALVLKLLKNGIPEKAIFHDLYLRKYSNNYSQIDLVVATKEGLIVFEIKDYSGWIFGNGYKPQWTQVLAYGRQKYRFYNPILQNNKHIEDLKKSLPLENVPCFSIIVFYGDCTLKDITSVPNNTFLVKPYRVLEVLELIAASNKPAKYNDKWEVVRVLKEAVLNGEDIAIQNQHAENVRNMLSKDKIFN